MSKFDRRSSWDGHEVLSGYKKVHEAERLIRLEVRDSCRRFLQKCSERIPDFVMKILVLSQLFGAETVMAETSLKRLPSGVEGPKEVAESQFETGDVNLSPETRKFLDDFFKQNPEMRVGVHSYSAADGSVIETKLGPKDFVDGKVLQTDGRIFQWAFQRELPVAALGEFPRDESWLHYSDEEEKTETWVGVCIDTGFSDVDVYRQHKRGESFFSEFLHVVPNPAVSGDSVSHEIDLRGIGGPERFLLFEGGGLEEVDVSVEFDVFQHGMDAQLFIEENPVLFDQIAAAYTSSKALYGDLLLSSKFIFSGNKFELAGASRASFSAPDASGAVILHEGIFSEAKKHGDSVFLEEVVEHELIHLIERTHEHGFLMFKLVYYRASSDAVGEFNESNFFGFDMGGHGEDNATEFFASFVNSLDHDDWARRVGELSPEAQQLAVDMLEALIDDLDEIKRQGKDAAVLRLLFEKRLAELT